MPFQEKRKGKSVEAYQNTSLVGSISFPYNHPGNCGVFHDHRLPQCMERVHLQVSKYTVKYKYISHSKIVSYRAEFATAGNVLNNMNYAKNFYLYCFVHEDIRAIALSKVTFLIRKLKCW